LLIENYTALDADLRMGLAGTQIVFNALDNGEIDLYPEYTGTGLHVLLEPDSAALQQLGNDSEAVYGYVREQTSQQFGLIWLEPIGFENTYALLMRREEAEELGMETIGDLVKLLSIKNRE
jgi:osmoprotectant transport system permease protein